MNTDVQQQPLKKKLSFKEGIDLTPYSYSYGRKLCHLGILPFSKPNNGKIVFDRDELEAWLSGNPRASHAERQQIAATYITTHK